MIKPLNRVVLVTGPSRSGKSEWAEQLAARSGQPVVYVATAQLDAHDPEWQARIAQHQLRRPAEWVTLTVPIALAATIGQATADQCLLVDSLGTWLANCLEEDEATWADTVKVLLESLQTTASRVILVAEEVGWGVVPAYPLGRKFRDRLGSVVRQIGGMAHPTYLVTAGHVLNLSTLGQPFLGNSSDLP